MGQLGKKGGSVKSEKKSASSAENGKKGGRPPIKRDIRRDLKNGTSTSALVRTYGEAALLKHADYTIAARPDTDGKAFIGFYVAKGMQMEIEIAEINGQYQIKIGEL